jgi:hypothetical protein
MSTTNSPRTAAIERGFIRTTDQQHDFLLELLKEIERTRFYGELEIKFEAGKAVHVWKSESIKPPTNSIGSHRGQNNAEQRR